jgi:hypothetical protein
LKHPIHTNFNITESSSPQNPFQFHKDLQKNSANLQEKNSQIPESSSSLSSPSQFKRRFITNGDKYSVITRDLVRREEEKSNSGLNQRRRKNQIRSRTREEEIIEACSESAKEKVRGTDLFSVSS